MWGLLFCCLLFARCRQLFAVRCLLFVVCCLLLVVCCLLAVVSCCCLLSVVCCLLSACCRQLFAVRCLFTLCTLSFRSLFVLCSLPVCCRQLFASCMPAAVGRKIKYRFHAWQAPEVFSKRKPLIFSHYLCHCGSFFSSRICGIYVRPPSVFLPSAIRKVPGETAFLHHLLEFVMGRPAPGVSLASPAREPHPEGAGESAVCPSPFCLGTWHPLTPSEGVSKSRHFLTPSEGVIRKGRAKEVKKLVYRPSSEVMRSGRRPAGP